MLTVIYKKGLLLISSPNVKKKAYRNNSAFVLLAWVSFGFFVVLMLVGLYTLKEPLMVKGYYLMGSVGLISSSFTVAKVVRDSQEDNEMYEQIIKDAAAVQNARSQQARQYETR